MKAGYKTTEFWMTLLAALVGFVVSSGALENIEASHWAVRLVGGLTVLLTTLGYTVTRGKVKSSESNKATAEALKNGSGGDNN